MRQRDLVDRQLADHRARTQPQRALPLRRVLGVAPAVAVRGDIGLGALVEGHRRRLPADRRALSVALGDRILAQGQQAAAFGRALPRIGQRDVARRT